MSIATSAPIEPEAKPETTPRDPGHIFGYLGRWHFKYDPKQTPKKSSGRKLVIKGKFKEATYQDPIAARALAFEPTASLAFGVECANLGLLTSLGVGPKLLAIVRHEFEMLSNSRLTIIEEDAGICLADLLIGKHGRMGPQPILHDLGTVERSLENKKILYDVFVQLYNAHGAGIYHRDLRCENVCVRRYGEAPADIRATIIDFDLSMNLSGGVPGEDEKLYKASLYDTIFSKIPSRLSDGAVSWRPNHLEIDMGYLAAMQYHLQHDNLILNNEYVSSETVSDFAEFLAQGVSYFGYRQNEPPYARNIAMALDIDPLARNLSLTPVAEEAFESKQLLAYAASFHKPYLDGEDMQSCMCGPEARLAETIDAIVSAKYESYKNRRRAEGKEVIERYTDQPMDFQRSNYAQAEHIPVKVQALGYQLVFEYDSEVYEKVTSFSDEQIELLARLEHDRWIEERLSMGWTLDRTIPDRIPEKKLSPHLVPYDELSEATKGYDRDTARQLIPLVNSVGLTVVRPK